jgi:hypothetical protein
VEAERDHRHPLPHLHHLSRKFYYLFISIIFGFIVLKLILIQLEHFRADWHLGKVPPA